MTWCSQATSGPHNSTRQQQATGRAIPFTWHHATTRQVDSSKVQEKEKRDRMCQVKHDRM
jgi:hypothetical protein